MRISDWSSDVCSSDLEKRRASAGIGRSHAKAGRYFDHPTHDRMRVTSSHMATKNSGKPIAKIQMRWLLSMTLHLPSMTGRALTLYLREIGDAVHRIRSEEHTSELQSLMRISYAVFCLNKKNKQN